MPEDLWTFGAIAPEGAERIDIAGFTLFAPVAKKSVASSRRVMSLVRRASSSRRGRGWSVGVCCCPPG